MENVTEAQAKILEALEQAKRIDKEMQGKDPNSPDHNFAAELGLDLEQVIKEFPDMQGYIRGFIDATGPENITPEKMLELHRHLMARYTDQMKKIIVSHLIDNALKTDDAEE